MSDGIRKKRVDLELYNLIQDIYFHVPKIHHADDEFMEGLVSINKFKIKAALKHIVKLASDSDHYFSPLFWKDLVQCAGKLKMPKVAGLCKAQLDRSFSALSFNTPKGWTTVKIDASHFKHYIADTADRSEPS